MQLVVTRRSFREMLSQSKSLNIGNYHRHFVSTVFYVRDRVII